MRNEKLLGARQLARSHCNAFHANTFRDAQLFRRQRRNALTKDATPSTILFARIRNYKRRMHALVRPVTTREFPFHPKRPRYILRYTAYGGINLRYRMSRYRLRFTFIKAMFLPLRKPPVDYFQDERNGIVL